MLGAEELWFPLTSTAFFVHTMEVNKNGTFFKNIILCSTDEWKSKWFGIYIFGWSIPLNNK